MECIHSSSLLHYQLCFHHCCLNCCCYYYGSNEDEDDDCQCSYLKVSLVSCLLCSIPEVLFSSSCSLSHKHYTVTQVQQVHLSKEEFLWYHNQHKSSGQSLMRPFLGFGFGHSSLQFLEPHDHSLYHLYPPFGSTKRDLDHQCSTMKTQN